jgi:hypothetical protein
MFWLTAIGAILCGWATLAVLGGERQRRLQRLQLLHAAHRPAPAEPKQADAKPRSAWPTRPGRAAAVSPAKYQAQR